MGCSGLEMEGSMEGVEWGIEKMRNKVTSILTSISYFSSGAPQYQFLFTMVLLHPHNGGHSLVDRGRGADAAGFSALGQGWGREKLGRWLSPSLLGPRNMVDGYALGLSTHRSEGESCSRTVVVNVKSQVSQKF